MGLMLSSDIQDARITSHFHLYYDSPIIQKLKILKIKGKATKKTLSIFIAFHQA